MQHELQLAGSETSQLVFTNFLPSGDDNASRRCPAHARQWNWEVTYKVSAVFSPFEPLCKGHKPATCAESKALSSVPHFYLVDWFCVFYYI